MSRGDVWSGGVLATLGSYVVFAASQWEYLGPDGPGPGFFPLWYGVALVVLSLSVVIGGLRKRLAKTGDARERRHEIGRALAVWGALAASSALLSVLGFLLSFALLTGFIICVMYGRPLRTGLAAAVLGALGFYLVFPVALEVALPVGMMGF